MSEVKRLPDGSLMNEENCLYGYSWEYVNGKPVIPDGVEDISAFTFSQKEMFNEYDGCY